MTNRFLLSLLVGLAMCPPADACLKIGTPPKSWRKTSENGQYVFVMRADDERDDYHSRASQAQLDEVAALRGRYAQAGMYRADTGELLWATDQWLADQWAVGPVTVWVSDDGESVAWASAVATAVPRHRGPVERALFGEVRKPADPMSQNISAADWNRPALIILSRGRPPVSHTLGALVGSLEESGRWLAWVEFDGPQLLVTTFDDQRVTLDVGTGAITGRRDLLRLDRYYEPAFLGVIVYALVAARLRRWQAKAVLAVEDSGTMAATP